MPHLKISTKVAQKLQALSEQTSVTTDEILLRLLDNYASIFVSIDDTVACDDLTWTEEELADILKPRQPLTGKQIVDKHLESGVIGSWSDMAIGDSVEWLEQQKAARRNKYQW